MSSTDNVGILLSARAGVYRTLQNALGNEPSIEMLEQFCEDAMQSIFLLFDTGQDTYRQAVDDLFAVAANILADGDEPFLRLEGRFTRLFVGPGGTEGNPWESFYLNKDKALRQGVTLEVRKAYVAEGLIPHAYPTVSDDHIAIELDFLVKLAERAQGAQAEGDTTKALEALRASEAFLREHLLKWTSLFVAALRKARHGAAFYQETAAVLDAFLPIDLNALANLQIVLKGQT